MNVIFIYSKLRAFILKTLSSLLYGLYAEERRTNGLLKQIENKYKGKRIFIICNGPSLKVEDLDILYEFNEFSMASNKIDKIFDNTKWRPNFYAVFDQKYGFTLQETMKRIPAEYKFFRKETYSKTRNVGGKCLYLNTCGDRSLLENPKFSEDLNPIYTIGTVTYAMIQIAVFMGFEHIYILGADNNYAKNISLTGVITESGSLSHFSGGEQKEDSRAVAVWEMDRGYYYAREFADKKGIYIYNSTRGGYLEAFKRVDFDSIFHNS